MTTEERLEKLEKELMRGRRFNLCLLAELGLVIGAWIVGWAFRPGTSMAQPTEAADREVRAQRFVVENANGKTLAMLGEFKDGVELQLSDENGKPRVVLIAGKDVSELQLLKGNGEMRAWLHTSNRMSLLQLNDENGHYRLGLQVFKDGPKLDLCDENMVVSGKPRVEIGASKDGPKLQLYDAKGKTLWKAP